MIDPRRTLATVAFCIWAVAATTALSSGCSRPSPPPVAPGAAPWAALVEAGCVADDPAGPADLVAEEQLDAGAPGWLGCLFDGGSVASCGVPCDAATASTPRPTRALPARAGGW